MPKPRSPRTKSKRQSRRSSTNLPTISLILKYLVDKYGSELGLPGWDDQDFVSGLARKTRVSPGTARNLREGLSNHPQAKIRERLVDLFREAVPHLEPQWLLYEPLELFIERVEQEPKDRKVITLSIPMEGYRQFDRLHKQGDSKNRILQGLTRLSNQILSASQRQTLEALRDAHALGCFE